MKLTQIAEWTQAPLPRELQVLYQHYWRLRAQAMAVVPGSDPYICNLISGQIFRHLKQARIPIQLHTGGADDIGAHMWALVKLPAGNFIVDGSYYQADYERATTGIIPGELGKRLAQAGITDLAALLAVIDTKMDNCWLGDKDYAKQQARYRPIAAALTDRQLHQLQGRLLPLLLRITPADDSRYEGSKYDPETEQDLFPLFDSPWSGTPEPIEQDDF